MATPFDSISLKIASPKEIKELAKRTCCKRRSSTVAPGEPFVCPEMHTCNCGEVKKAETINYRSFRPELEGLFCEAIFGPSKDWECNCGKYKRIKYKGVICDRCGVEVTRQHVRRERMGYIQLASPVSHIWFFKGVPSRIGAFCDFSARQIENILYFDAFMVTEADEELQAQGILKPNQLISEAEFDTYKRQYRGRFKAGAGGEILAKHLANLDLEAEREKLAKEFEETRSHQKKVKLAKQLRLMEDFMSSGQRPEWMILDVLPVIPPDLRPLVTLDGGRFATSDLNDLYRRLIHRNNRLAKLIKMRSPEVILRNEKRMLQEAVDAFFDNGRHGRRVTGPGNRELKSLSHVLKGKVGRFRQNLLGKRVDYSGRSVIVVGPELALHQCGIPKQMAVELFKPFIIERLQAYGYSGTIKRAKAYVEQIDSNSPVWDVLEEVIEDHPVLLNRPPTLHRLGIQAFTPVLVEGKSIRIPPLVCKAFNADFDGDQMAVHVPLTAEAQAEAKLLMLSSHNILKPSHGGPIAVPELDMVLGPSYLTKTLPEHDADAQLLHEVYTTRNGDTTLFDEIRRKPWYHRRYVHPEEVIAAHGAGHLKLHDSVQLFFPENGTPREPILTTVGRVIFNEVLPAKLEWVDAHSRQQLPFFNGEAGGRQLSAIVETCFNNPELGTRATVELLENLQKLAFEYATQSGISPGIIDYITPPQRAKLLAKTEAAIAKLRAASAADADTEELENEQIRLWFQALREMEAIMFSTLPELETRLVDRDEHVKGFSPVQIMADSGARARKNPFMQISAVIGLKAKQSGEILLPPITTSYRDGLDVIDYFNSTYGSRKGLVDTAMKTAASGYLTRKLVDVAQDVRVTETDCGTLHGIKKFATEGGELAFKIRGRTATEDILHPTGEVLVKADELISAEAAALIEKSEVKTVTVRSVLTCETEEGVCAKCYGHDLTTNMLVSVGEAVGIIAAQSIGEPGTQLTMRTFHTGGAVEEVSDARQREILAEASGTVHFRDLYEGYTVRKEGGLWISTGSSNFPVDNIGLMKEIGIRVSLDEPAWKVTRVTHPNCPLRKDELLNEKQYSENAQRYKGFDTEAWQHRVTAVHDDACPLKEGDRLSAAQWHQARIAHGFRHFATEKREIAHVRLSTVNVRPGDALTDEEIEQRKAEIRNQFDGEWCYRIPKTGEIFKSAQDLLPGLGIPVEPLEDIEDTEMLGDTSDETADDLTSADTSLAEDTSFERVYRITKRTHRDFPYAVGDIVAAEEIAPWLTPFEVAQNPVYVIDANAPWHAGETLTRYQYEEACRDYRPFESESASEVLHHVTAVHHPRCPLKPGQDLTAADKDATLARWTGFEAQRLRHRVMYIHRPDAKIPRPCVELPRGVSQGAPESPFEQEVCEFLRKQEHNVSTQVACEVNGYQHQIAIALESEEPEHYILAIECDAQEEKDAPRYRALESAGWEFHHIGLTEWEEKPEEAKSKLLKAVEDASYRPLKQGDFLTASEAKQLQREYPRIRLPELKRLNRVTAVYHPNCFLQANDLLTSKDTSAYHREFKAFDTERIHEVTEADIYKVTEDKPAFLASNQRSQDAKIASTAEALPRAKHVWRVTEVFDPACPYEVGQEMSSTEYKKACKAHRGVKQGDILSQAEWEAAQPLAAEPAVHLSEPEYKARLKMETQDKTRSKTAPRIKDKVTSRYRVLRFHHPDFTFEVGAELTDKEYKKGQRDFKAFEVERSYELPEGLYYRASEDKPIFAAEAVESKKIWRVTEVFDPACPYEVGQEMSSTEYKKACKAHRGVKQGDILSQAEWEAAQPLAAEPAVHLSEPEYKARLKMETQDKTRSKTAPRIKDKVTSRYRVLRFHHPDFTFEVGAELTDKEYKKGQRDFKAFEVERSYELPEGLYYRASEDKPIFAAEAVESKKIWRVTEVFDLACPYEVGRELTDADYRKASKKYPGFKQGDLLTQAALETWKDNLAAEKVTHRLTAVKPGFTAEELTGEEKIWRVTEVSNTTEHPYEVGQTLADADYQKACKDALGLTQGELLTQADLAKAKEALKTGQAIAEPVTHISEMEYRGLLETDRTFKAKVTLRYRVLRVNNPKCGLEVGAILTEEKHRKLQQDFKGFEVEVVYGVNARTYINPRGEVIPLNVKQGARITSNAINSRTPLCYVTEEDYDNLRDRYPGVRTDEGKPALRMYIEVEEDNYSVTAVYHPECPLQANQLLTPKELTKHSRKFKGFDVVRYYDVPCSGQSVSRRLSEKAYRTEKKTDPTLEKRAVPVYRVVRVHHPKFAYEVGTELTLEEYKQCAKECRGFEVEKNRARHLIPDGYSFKESIEGKKVKVGAPLAELHEKTANMDIVAGIPRVTDLFEARRPKREDAAEIAEIEGYLESAGTKRGLPTYRIVHEEHESRLYEIPDEKRRVTEGDRVKAGQPLTDGYLNPHDILSIGRVFIEDEPIDGEEAVWAYLVEEIQKVYGARAINDKHLEAIVRQMTRKVRVIAPGDTQFPHNSEVPRQKFNEVNAKVTAEDGEPATGEPILQGISRASLSTESFISAASFQQTTKVLTDAAVKGQTDKLFGLKENVILGRLIPAGSGLSDFHHLEVTEVDTDEEMEAPESSE